MDIKVINKLYKSIGGEYQKVAEASSDTKTVARPLDMRKWKFAKDQCSTNKRVCRKCNGGVEVDQPGKLVKCCDDIMDIVREANSDVKSQMYKELPAEEEEKTYEPSDAEKSQVVNIMDKLEKHKKGKRLRAAYVEDDNLVNSYWVVKKGNKPVYKVAVKEAFQDDPSHPACLSRFKAKDYGRNLVGMIKKYGASQINEEIYGGRGLVFGQANSAAPDFLAAEPSIEDEDSENQGASPSGEQAGEALVSQETGDELLEDKPDKHEVLELLSDAIVPILIASGNELIADDVVREIQTMVTNPQALAEWQGQLEEKIRSSKIHADQEGDEAIEEEANAARPETPPPTQQPMATAPVVQSKLTAKLRGQIRGLSDDLTKTAAAREKAEELLQKTYTECKKLESHNVELKKQNQYLLREREYNKTVPRARRLAQKMVDLDITPPNEIDSCVSELIQLDSESFIKKEAEINRVHNRFEDERKTKSSKQELNTKGVLGTLPPQAGTDKVAERKSDLFMWNNPKLD